MDYLLALRRRYSVKKFDADRKIAPEVMDRIYQAAQLSVSSLGLQPYKIWVTGDRPKIENLIPAFQNPTQLETCSHLAIITVHRELTDNYIDSYFDLISKTRDTPAENLQDFKNGVIRYRNAQAPASIQLWNEKQSYIVLGNLIFAAALENVDTCPMEGFHPAQVANLLKIDKRQYTVTAAVAFGYRAADDPFAQFKKVRKPMAELFIEF